MAEASLKLICYFIIRTDDGWIWRELWYNRLSGELRATAFEDKDKVYPRKRYCINAIMNINYSNIPIVSTPLSLRNLLEEKDIPYTEDKLVKLYTRNKVKEGWFL